MANNELLSINKLYKKNGSATQSFKEWYECTFTNWKNEKTTSDFKVWVNDKYKNREFKRGEVIRIEHVNYTHRESLKDDTKSLNAAGTEVVKSRNNLGFNKKIIIATGLITAFTIGIVIFRKYNSTKTSN